MKMGMKKNDSSPTKLSDQELQLIEQLREHPLLLERFEAIRAITAHAAGPLKSADEVEGLLIEPEFRNGMAAKERKERKERKEWVKE